MFYHTLQKLGIKMSEIHRHEGITKRRHISAYRHDLGEVTRETGEEVFDVRLLKLMFVGMAAAVAFGLSILAVTL